MSTSCATGSTDDSEMSLSVLVLEWAVSGIHQGRGRGELLPARCSSSCPCAQHPNEGKKNQTKKPNQPLHEWLGQEQAQAPFISKSSPGYYL